jgi:hypothetical protein
VKLVFDPLGFIHRKATFGDRQIHQNRRLGRILFPQ